MEKESKIEKQSKKESREEQEERMEIRELDVESVKRIMNNCFKEREYYSAGEIANLIGDIESVKKAVKACLQSKEYGKASEIAVFLVDKDPKLVEQVTAECKKYKKEVDDMVAEAQRQLRSILEDNGM